MNSHTHTYTHIMSLNEQTLSELAACLEKTLSPQPDVRRPGTYFLSVYDVCIQVSYWNTEVIVEINKYA